jgi:hypothetical protein
MDPADEAVEIGKAKTFTPALLPSASGGLFAS